MEKVIKRKSMLMASVVAGLFHTTLSFGMEVERTDITDHEHEIATFLDAHQRDSAFHEIRQLLDDCKSHVVFKTDWPFLDEYKNQELASKVKRLEDLTSWIRERGQIQPHEEGFFAYISKELTYYHTGSYEPKKPLEMVHFNEDEYYAIWAAAQNAISQ